MKALTPSPAKPSAHSGARRGTTFHFEARDVTGTHILEARMALPRNVPWMLRDDATGALLDEAKPVGEQIESGAKVVLSPKAHLG